MTGEPSNTTCIDFRFSQTSMSHLNSMGLRLRGAPWSLTSSGKVRRVHLLHSQLVVFLAAVGSCKTEMDYYSLKPSVYLWKQAEPQTKISSFQPWHGLSKYLKSLHIYTPFSLYIYIFLVKLDHFPIFEMNIKQIWNHLPVTLLLS